MAFSECSFTPTSISLASSQVQHLREESNAVHGTGCAGVRG